MCHQSINFEGFAYIIFKICPTWSSNERINAAKRVVICATEGNIELLQALRQEEMERKTK